MGNDKAGNPFVDGSIGLEIGIAEMGKVDAVVEDRPDDPVGILQVEAVMFSLCEVGDDEIDTLVTENLWFAGVVFHNVAGPSKPHAAG